ncbi:MAG: hypothetical protein Q8P68_05975 [Candidatus Peregrinibacteria bacterium]|nr:hypothetical protein [Candidatus Peregrinibacteria bacterium]MDZ4244943.1 hypothetical protein [Candidatus Gracilibacteria bacterium]
MKQFYNKLSKSKKIIFLILKIQLFTLIGAIFGFILGLLAINFIPDQCVIEGISTICQNPFEFLGLIGWEGTSALGFMIGAAIGLLAYLWIFFRPESKK